MPNALVTGASSGIGRTFARTLAARGYDIVAVARDKQRLDQLAEELQGAHGTAVEVLPADLCDAAQLATVEERLVCDPAIDLLVNNAGFGAQTPFVSYDVDAVESEIRLNVLALTRLTRAVLPAMVARRAGGIVNVSSFGSLQPGPRFAVYVATKAYVTNFTESLHEELRGSAVNIVALCPGFTRTEFHERNGVDSTRVPSMAWSTPEEVVEAALKALERGQAVCFPGLSTKLVAGLSHLLPRAAVRRTAGAIANRL
ncbi:MAG TPA: SDR family oxidoreductase [Acidimicrobiales bacterium]|nr:SDR family oxidoreductase [Acidimicrobiales bacterium]